MDGRPVFSIRSMASSASPSHENVSAMTKSGDSRNLPRDADRGSVNLGHAVGEAGRRKLVLAPMEREGLQDLRARIEKFLVELSDRRGVLDHDLWGEGARLHVPALLELQEVPPTAQDGSLREPLEDSWTLGRGTTR